MNCMILVCKIVLGIYQGQVIMKKSLLMIPCFGLLAACGGSDGGGSDETDPPYGYCSNAQEMTCTYPVSQLELRYTMYLRNDNSMYFRGDFYSDYKPPIYPYEMYVSDIDRVEIVQDGVVHSRENLSGIEFPTIDAMGAMYEFNWYRNDELVGYTTLDRLPEPISDISINSYELTNSVRIQWSAASDHRYDIDIHSLRCYSNGDVALSKESKQPNYIVSEGFAFASFDLLNHYNETIEGLKENYDQCSILADINGRNLLSVPDQHIGNITLNFKSNETLYIELF